ncbi:MAG: SpaA isopeptide-forming pilin-related protein, partial [Acutalibacteraceae bacterium]|nr:SpaA isopeptide-forming pilin-related protein [Acutalibacteraceae bacterium]
ISIVYNSKNALGEVVENKQIIPELTNAKADDNIAYVNTSDDKLYLVNRCRCISATCNHWDSDVCYSMFDNFSPEYEAYYDDWCTCWNLKYNATVTIEYKNNEIPRASGNNVNLLNDYAGSKYVNTVTLSDSDDTDLTSEVELEIPKLITKTLPEKFTKNNHFMGTYKIVVNESKIDLSNVDQNGDKKPDETILIQDIMTNVGYIPGTLTITSSNPDVPKLEYGRDYEIEYIPGNQQVGETYTATLNITLKNNKFNADSEIKNALGPYTYTIEYDAQAISTTDEGIAARVRTVNKATIAIAIYGFPGSDVVFNTTFASGWSYLRRGLTIHKFDLDTSEPLAGAVFGLYTQDGTLIATGEPTGDDGNYTFSTDVRKGIIFKEDIAYYVAELGAPEGYNRVNTPHWFYFADEEFTNEELQMLKLLDANIQFCGLDGEDTVGIPNEKGLVLPETGGNGAFIYIATGLILLCIAAYGLYKKFLFRKEATF